MAEYNSAMYICYIFFIYLLMDIGLLALGSRTVTDMEAHTQISVIY